MTKRALVLPLLIAAVITFSGCSKYGHVNLNYPLSPVVYLPENVGTIALANRTFSEGEDKQKNILESIATAEIAGSDRLASDECLRAVYDHGNGQRGMEFVIPLKSRLPRKGARETPELLDWKLVKAICDSTHADALLVLETFDSNSDLLVSTAINQIETVLNGGTPKPALPDQIRVNVVAFWRLYDPSKKKIIDQYSCSSYLTFHRNGEQFTLPSPATLQSTAYEAGREYIQRFLPGYYSVRRDMYKTGKGASKQKFEAAFRRAEVANWQGAIDDWSKIAEHADRENAGRACLDIAVSFEVLGNTDLALQWAKKSYEEYDNKLGKEYAKILLQRKSIEYSGNAEGGEWNGE